MGGGGIRILFLCCVSVVHGQEEGGAIRAEHGTVCSGRGMSSGVRITLFVEDTWKI